MYNGDFSEFKNNKLKRNDNNFGVFGNPFEECVENTNNKRWVLTCDDLIVEYMMYKVRNGYEPSFTIKEFLEFLKFFESKMEVLDTLDDGEKLFQRFFERKSKSGWSSKPHMDIVYSEKDKDYLIKANYMFGEYDRSIISTYFMYSGVSQFNDIKKEQVFCIRRIIKEFLEKHPKRIIDEDVNIKDDDLLIEKYIAAVIINNIWDSHIKKLVEKRMWPKQCNDINKYLFEIDLGEIIGVESIKDKLIELYCVFSKRIAVLYSLDRNLKISDDVFGEYLARANYDLLIKGYEDIMVDTFGTYKKSLKIDLNSLKIKNSYIIKRNYSFGNDFDVKIVTSEIGNEKVKKLVKSLDGINL